MCRDLLIYEDLASCTRSNWNLNNPFVRLGTMQPADIPNTRTLTTQRDMLVKLNISCGFELANVKISVYFSNIGLKKQLIERVMTEFQEL